MRFFKHFGHRKIHKLTHSPVPIYVRVRLNELR